MRPTAVIAFSGGLRPVGRQKQGILNPSRLPLDCVALISLMFWAWGALGLSNACSAQDLPPALAEADPIRFLTGKKLDRRNLKPISVFWHEAPVRDQLLDFSGKQNIAVMVDRRVVANHLISVGVDNLTVENFLWAVADAAEIGVCRIEDCYYFGPAPSVAELPIHIDQLTKRVTKKLSRRSPVKWTSRRPLQTSVVAQPKDILTSLANENGFTIRGIDSVPHDLWPALSLPPTTLYSRVQLILAGFGKTFEIANDGQSIEIIDFPKISSAKREFPIGKKIEDVAAIRAEFPKLKIRFRGKRVTGTGAPQDLAALKKRLVQITKGTAGQQQRFSLTTESDRLTILRTIAEQSKLELVLDRVDAAELQDRVAIDVALVSRRQLIFEVLSGSEFSADVQGQQLIVRPR